MPIKLITKVAEDMGRAAPRVAVWLLAQKMKEKGFANLFDYFSREFKDPETGKTPTSPLEFAETAANPFYSGVAQALDIFIRNGLEADDVSV